MQKVSGSIPGTSSLQVIGDVNDCGLTPSKAPGIKVDHTGTDADGSVGLLSLCALKPNCSTEKKNRSSIWKAKLKNEMRQPDSLEISKQLSKESVMRGAPGICVVSNFKVTALLCGFASLAGNQ